MGRLFFPYGSNVLDQVKAEYIKQRDVLTKRLKNWEKKWEDFNPKADTDPVFEGDKEMVMWEISAEIDEGHKALEIAEEKISAIGQVLVLQIAYDRPLTITK